MEMEPTVYYRKYLFHSGQFKDWIEVWKNGANIFALRFIKKYCVLLSLLVNLVCCTMISDGTGRQEVVGKLVTLMQGSMDVYEKAYTDIERLAGSIGVAANVQDPDECFMFAFLITKWSREFGFDPLEVAAVALTESQFNRKAVSSKDARGLMQIHAPTWNMDDYFNAEKNIKKAMQILYMYRNSQPDSYLKRYYGDTGKNGNAYVKKVKESYKKIQQNL